MLGSRLPALSGHVQIEAGQTDEEAAVYREWTSSEAYQFTNTARATLRQCFEDNDRFSLPTGHPALVLSETQVYQTLRVLCGETVSTAYNLIQALVTDIADLRAPAPSRHEKRTSKFRHPNTPLPSQSGGSEDESVDHNNVVSSDGDTSGAMHTGDETGSVTFTRETAPTDAAGFWWTSEMT